MAEVIILNLAFVSLTLIPLRFPWAQLWAGYSLSEFAGDSNSTQNELITACKSSLCAGGAPSSMPAAPLQCQVLDSPSATASLWLLQHSSSSRGAFTGASVSSPIWTGGCCTAPRQPCFLPVCALRKMWFRQKKWEMQEFLGLFQTEKIDTAILLSGLDS